MAQNGKHSTQSPEDLNELERIARTAPKAWRTQKALRKAGFRKVPGGLPEALALSRFARLSRQMRQLRRRSGLSRAELARRMGITVKQLAQLERENLEQATLSTLQSFARAVGADLRLSLQPTS